MESNSTAFLIKIKLRHSLGSHRAAILFNPSLSDSQQFNIKLIQAL